MQNIWKNHRWVIITMLAIWLVMIGWLLTQGKENAFLHIHNQKLAFLDTSMPYLTFLGDGIFVSLIGFLLLFKSYRSAFILLSAFVVSGLLAQFLKGVVFPDMLRPLAYFENIDVHLQTLEDVKVRRRFSFPSGHTTSAFALFISLILVFRHNALAFIFLFLAFTAGYSRIYLGQHFTEDVLAGAILGTFTALLFYCIWQRPNWQFLDRGVLTKRDA